MNEQIIDVEVTERSIANNQIFIDKIIPAVIESNIDEFEVNVQDISRKYMNLVVDENAIKQAKEDRALLNKAIKSVVSVRKQIEEKVEVNIRSLYEKLKGCESILKSCSDNIDEQIKKFEQQEKEEKRAKINGWIKSIKQTAKDSRGLTDAYLDLFQFDEKWLNKSASDKSIQEAILTQINTIGQKFLDDKALKENNINTIKETIKRINDSFKLNTPIKENKYMDLLDKNIEMAQISSLIIQDAETQKKAEESAVKQAEQVTMSKVLEEIREEDKKKAEAIQQAVSTNPSSDYEMVFTYTFGGTVKDVQQFGAKFAELAKEYNVELKPIEGYLNGKQVFPKGGTK